jgi:sterol desaturase/sphingolipid hydroxylase (fatty acid hydroxylase superfamily)
MFESALRAAVFLFVLTLLALLEKRFQFRTPSRQVPKRWGQNFLLVLLGIVFVRIVLPYTAVEFAENVVSLGWGILPHIGAPQWLAVTVSVLILDLTVYFQHLWFHRIPWFWRLHRVHHADVDFDVSTGLRFHPFEILISMLIKFWVILLIGADPLAVLVFEIVLNATSLFEHTNIAFPTSWDRRLRWAIVTPNMHRIHHSIRSDERNSNFGFSFSIWDRIFRTYTAKSIEDPRTMPIGLESFRSYEDAGVRQMLLQPFR